jgi:RNHCP domain
VSFSRTKPSRGSSRGQGQRSARGPIEQEFICISCGQLVTCNPLVAGVQNRNHCPVCLWSRHLDWRSAGDRLSPCRAAMEPVGLTTKRGRNKYADERDGELMLIHRCAGCGTLVINRIAADDHVASLLGAFEALGDRDQALRAALVAMGVTPLGPDERSLVYRRLYGGR